MVKIAGKNNKYDGMEETYLELTFENYFQTKTEANLPI
jgi:hypothetical protein